MSVRCSAIVWDASPAEGSELLVELALADQAGDDGVTWVTVSRLAKKCRLSERQVIRVIKASAEAGRLQVRKAQRGRIRCSVYRLVGPGLRPVDYDRFPFALDAPFADDMTPRHMTPASPRGSSPRHDTGGSDGMTPHARVPEPSGKRKIAGATAPAARSDQVWDMLAELFGAAETHGARSLRGKIAKSLKAAGADANEIKARAERYAKVMPPGTLLTETALEKHWPLLEPTRRNQTAAVCPECQMGGGYHASACSKGWEGSANARTSSQGRV